jgi:3-hydroxyisobutyrate dehydrogenase
MAHGKSRELRIGFVGAGDLGGEIARRILRARRPLTLFARREEVRRDFRDAGAAIAADLAELGRSSDLVGICVIDGVQVKEVLLGAGLLSGLRPGGLIAIHSTIHPETCREIAAAAAERGVAVIDAPVSGSGGYTPQDRPMTVMVGGDAADFERARPVLEDFATTVRHVGPLGSGELTKIINNCLYYAQKALAVDAVAIARAAGLDVRAAGDVWSLSSGNSHAFQQYRTAGFTGLVPRSSGDSRQSLTVIRKDLRLAAEIAEAAGVDCRAGIAMGNHLVDLLEAAAAREAAGSR